jgi:MFS family permease/quinol monooxygenase YgiN
MKAAPLRTSSTRRLPAWAPLRSPLFRALWLASLASNVGSWMHDVGASWLMTTLTRDAGLNALVSSAGALPMFLLALPAGALADIIDRRKLLIATQSWALLVTGGLAALTFAGAVSPTVVILFTLLLSLGSALTAPAWQAVIPEIVKKNQLSAAISLGGIAFNIARVLGPTVGGVIIGLLAPSLGDIAAPGAVFAINALSFSGVVAVLVFWKRASRESDLPPEHIRGAIRTGLRYTRHSPELSAILTRVGGFILFGSALWAMLSLHSRQNLGLDATGYGSLLGFFGAGAILAGVSLERLRSRFSSDQLVKLSSVGIALSFVALCFLSNPWVVRVAMFGAGVSWPLAMLTFQVAVIRNAPDWLRSRAASMFLLVFTGGQFVGSIGWGTIARFAGIRNAFLLAGCGMIASILVLRRFKISEGNQNFAASQHWDEPSVAFEHTPEEGPVLVTTEFNVPPESAREFVEAMQPIRLMRLRDGALRWNLFQDAADPTRWVETMLVESWTEHLRQHARVSLDSEALEAEARSFHIGAEPPRVSHLIAAQARHFEDEGEE